MAARDKKHICFIGTTLIPPEGQVRGSTAVFTWELAGILAEKKHKVSMVGIESYSANKQPRFMEIEYSEDLSLYIVPFFPYTKELHKNWMPFKTFFNLLRALRRINPDIIHAHGALNMAYLIGLLKAVFRKPTIITITRLDISRSLNRNTGGVISPLSRWARSKLLARIDFFVCMNVYISRDLAAHGVEANKIKIIPYGLKKEVQQRIEPTIKIPHKSKNGGKLVLFWGDGNLKRGFDVFLAAADKIFKEKPDTNLLIAVRGIEDGLEKPAEELVRRDERVKIFNNEQAPCPYNIMDIVATADIVALPFRINPVEPPLTLLESMALGKAVVTTSVGGNSEIINNHKNGVLIEPDPGQLADAVIYLLSNDGQRKEMGDNARASVLRKYNWAECVSAISDLYDSIGKTK